MAPGALARVAVFHSDVKSRTGLEFTFREWDILRSAPGGIEDLSAVTYAPVRLWIAGAERILPAAFVSAGYFTASGTRIEQGDGLSCAPDNDVSGCVEAVANPRYIPGEPSMLVVNGRSVPIRGLALPGPDSTEASMEAPAVWIPLRAAALFLGQDWIGGRDNHMLSIVGRLPAPFDTGGAGRRLQQALERSGPNEMAAAAHVTVAPAERSELMSRLRLSGKGSAFVVNYAPWLALILMILCAGAATLFALRSKQKRFFRASASALALALAGSAVGILLAAFLLKIFGILAAMHALPFRSPAPSVRAAMLALSLCAVACLAARLAAAPLRRRVGPSIRRLSIGAGTGYFILAVSVIVLVAMRAANGIFVGDFWDHSAAIRELAAHPFHPSNPVFRLSAPHQFFSPYSLALALLSRWSGLTAPDVLRAAGVANVCALLGFFYLFARRMFGTAAKALYGMACILFLWGPGAWLHSGFLHFNSLVETAGYPATLVSALTFLVWYAAVVFQNRLRWMLPVLLAAVPFSLISHPLTTIAMLVGLAAIACGREYPNRARLAIALAIAVAFGAAAWWPLFPIFDLTGQPARLNADAEWLYSNLPAIAVRTLPALLGIPLAVRRLRRDPRGFTGLTFAGLLAIYLYGGLTGRYIYGRVLPFLILMLQLFIADWLASAAFSISRRMRVLQRAVVALLLVCGLTAAPGIAGCLPVWQNSYGDFQFLSSYVKPSDVVLADEQTSLKEPSFGGRVVAFTGGHTINFVPDVGARDSDRQLFFQPSTTFPARRKIIEKYAVGYVLINRREVAEWPEILEETERLGRILYWNGDMILVKVRS